MDPFPNLDQQANPFFITNHDNPGIVLVSHPLLGESNYSTWRRAMTIALNAKNKLGFVDGSIPKPQIGDVFHQSWLRNNSIVSSWILNAISKYLTSTVIYCSSAAEMWSVLKDQFHQKDGPKVFQLKRDLLACTQGNLSVSAYYTKIRSLWEELSEFKPAYQCNCGGAQPLVEFMNKDHMITFLMGLNEQFSQVRGQILLMDPLPNISAAYSMILQEEKQREVGSSQLSNAQHQNLGKQKDTDMSPITHLQQFACAIQAIAAGKQKAYPKKDRPMCSHCGGIGHTVEKCFKLHGYPPGHKKGKPIASVNQVGESSATSSSSQGNGGFTNTQFQQMMTYIQQHMAQASTSDNPFMDNSTVGMSCSLLEPFFTPSSSTWIIDSGASAHICHDLSLFNNYSSLQNKFVFLPNQTRVQVVGSGTVTLGDHFLLHNVLYIPTFKMNLISLSSLLSRDKFQVVLSNQRCVIQDPQLSRTIGKGNLSHGLYLLEAIHDQTPHTNKQFFPSSQSNFHVPLDSVNVVCNKSTHLANLWHSRLGHLSDKMLHVLSSKAHFLVPADFSSHSCNVCPISKFKRLPFTSNTSFAALPFDLIHVDVWGPYNQTTHDGYSYFLTIVDDHNRFTWINLIKSKYDATVQLKRFIIMVHTQFKTTIKTIRSDNAKELALTEFL
jgi:hypothetical protein